MKSPMTDAEFRNYLDCSGRLVNEKGFRDGIYQGGIEHNLRKVAWRHLLNVFPPGMLLFIYYLSNFFLQTQLNPISVLIHGNAC